MDIFRDRITRRNFTHPRLPQAQHRRYAFLSALHSDLAGTFHRSQGLRPGVGNYQEKPEAGGVDVGDGARGSAPFGLYSHFNSFPVVGVPGIPITP